MKRLYFAVLILTLCVLLGGAASAQACLDYVSVDGTLLEGRAACYFAASEGVEHVYIKTSQLTDALGLESSYDPETSVLRFRKGQRVVEIAAVSDPEVGTEARTGVLEVDGKALKSSSAILAPDSFSYLPIEPMVEAFGGRITWNATASLVAVFSAPVPELASLPRPPERSERQPRTRLETPRFAEHEGYTRVALDLPKGVEYRLAVDGSNLIILFPETRAEPFELTPESSHLASLGYTVVGDTLALIVGTTHPLRANGGGFEVGELSDAKAGSKVLYVDFGPALRGERVARLQDLSRTGLATGLASVRRPANVRKTVVIDAGHGGKDPGTMSGYVTEKELVLNVALKLKARLEARGVRVILTRGNDHFLELEARANFTVPSEHNLFVSLHANAAENSDAQGVETWVFGEPQDDSVIDLAIAENGGGEIGRQRTQETQTVAASIDGDLLREENLSFSTSLAEIVQRELVSETGAVDRGVRNNYFVVIQNARIPAILVELGFVTHPEEGPKLATDAYQTKLAQALATGINTFLKQAGALAYTH